MSRPLLSLCLIARDESAVLPRCLDSARGLVDETVVVDTGSRDDTPAIARRHGARLIRTTWTHDFSEARNRSLAAAAGRFVLVLDADEWLRAGPAAGELRSRLSQTSEEAFTVELVDLLDGGAERRYPLVRLFRNRPEHRYEGCFHEQITPSIAARLGTRLIAPPESGVVVAHDGYRRESRERHDKASRNLDMLRERVRGHPEEASSRYFLARELVPIIGGRAVPNGLLQEALVHLEWLRERPGRLSPALAADAARVHAAALVGLERFRDASRVLADCEDRGVACELIRADVDMLAEPGGPAGAHRALRRIERCFDRETRDRGPFSEPALAGAIARCRAAEAHARLGRYEHAVGLLEQARRMPGGGAAPWNVRAVLERDRGAFPEALRAWVEAARADPTDPWTWLGLGETLLALGRRGDAVAPLRNASRLAPGWTAAERALAHARGSSSSRPVRR